jgi:glutaredoxin
VEIPRLESAEVRLAAKLAAFRDSLTAEERRSFDRALATSREHVPVTAERTHRLSGAALPSVTVYTVPGCAACESLKDYLAQRGIPASIKDVTTDRAAARDLVLVRRRVPGAVGAFPLVCVGGMVVVGFDVVRLNELLPA